MGLLIKIALFGIAAWGIYVTARKWYRLFSGEQPKPPQRAQPASPPPAAAQPAARRIVEDAQPCTVCGAFFTPGAAKCGRADCPLP